MARNLLAPTKGRNLLAGAPAVAQPQQQPTGSPALRMQRQMLGLDQAPIDPAFRESVKSRVGEAEVAATAGSALLAEPLAGLAGIRAGTSGAKAEVAAGAVEGVREALTYQPRTEKGKEKLSSVAEFLGPLGELFQKAEKSLGDNVYKRTESPALAAAATTIPTALMEVAGVAGAKGVSTLTKQVKKARLAGDIVSEIEKAVPTVRQLKDTSRKIFKEIDELGATMKPKAYSKLAKEVRSSFIAEGFDSQITPKAARLLTRIEDNLGKVVSTSEIEKLRTLATKVAGSADNAEAALGRRAMSTIDDFLTRTDTGALDIPSGAKTQVGRRYKAARELWGRATRSELVEEAFTKARNAPGGFDKGIVTSFRSILNNKKARKFFRPDELAEMKKVVRGTKVTNLAKLLGKFDIIGKSPGLVGTVGLAGALTAAGPSGFALPFVGAVSRKLGGRLIKNQAEFANQVIRAGKNANKITEAYIKHTPKAERSAAELSELLMRGDVDVTTLGTDPFMESVKQAVREGRAKVDLEGLGRTEGGTTLRSFPALPDIPVFNKKLSKIPREDAFFTDAPIYIEGTMAPLGVLNVPKNQRMMPSVLTIGEDTYIKSNGTPIKTPNNVVDPEEFKTLEGLDEILEDSGFEAHPVNAQIGQDTLDFGHALQIKDDFPFEAVEVNGVTYVQEGIEAATDVSEATSLEDLLTQLKNPTKKDFKVLEGYKKPKAPVPRTKGKYTITDSSMNTSTTYDSLDKALAVLKDEGIAPSWYTKKDLTTALRFRDDVWFGDTKVLQKGTVEDFLKE